MQPVRAPAREILQASAGAAWPGPDGPVAPAGAPGAPPEGGRAGHHPAGPAALAPDPGASPGLQAAGGAGQFPEQAPAAGPPSVALEGETALANALARLDAAITGLAGRLAGAQRDAKAADNLRVELERLTVALEASHQRERDLQRAAQEASQALDQAIAEVRAVLGEP